MMGGWSVTWMYDQYCWKIYAEDVTLPMINMTCTLLIESGQPKVQTRPATLLVDKHTGNGGDNRIVLCL